MLALFEKTWILWWTLASLIVLRWFHVVSATAPRDPYESADQDNGEYAIPGQLVSGT